MYPDRTDGLGQSKPEIEGKCPDGRLFSDAPQAAEQVVRGQTLSTKNGARVREALTTYTQVAPDRLGGGLKIGNQFLIFQPCSCVSQNGGSAQL